MQTDLLVKAPGKVLLAGGYSVLQEGNRGLVLALKKYFYVIVRSAIRSSSCPKTTIVVQSPQIKGRWQYLFIAETGELSQMHAEGNVNVFVAKAIWFSLMQFRPLSFSQIHLVILFDQGFLSGTTNSSSKFINYQTQCSKNGLGSSACVVVSIVKAICQLHQQKNELFIECLSHAANLAAQNKIGSNFDISSAIHGSHLYTNVLPRRAYSCIETGRIDNIVGLEQKNYVLSNTNKWVQNSCSLLVDMRKGSNTRIMVSGFLNQLQRMPQEIQREFFENSQSIVNKLYQAMINKQLNHQEFKAELNNINIQHRSLQQKYSKLTGIPIQPQQYQAILDSIAKLDQVYYCVCPGSGGYDAFFVIGYQKERMIDLVDKICKQHWQHCILIEVTIKWCDNMTVSASQRQQIFKYLNSCY